MNDDGRPDPDRLLQAIHAQEAREKRGALRVFLGMSAGVGKTYAMLEAARVRIGEGRKVVVGVVETHGRAETVALARDLPIIPRRRIEYKGVTLEEMDLDAILEARPDLVLVDELAHTNAPGSRHNKRYQDVIEILDAGIDVYTTINVQHLESRKDLVEKITAVPIRETVPDSVLELAEQIEVIDITPADLLKRLKEGKVYLGEKAERAAQNFFKPDSLTALREIALRFTAEKVDQELQQYLAGQAARGTWQTNERLMVAISHSPYSERLIRATRRLAFNLEAPWVAVHIDTGIQLSDADQAQLAKNVALARELRADVVTTSDTDIPSALRRIAQERNATQIVVGRPTRRWIKDMVEGGTLLDRLVRDSWDVDVHVIRQDGVPPARFQWRHLNFESGFVPYWNTFWLICGIAMVSGFVEPLIGYRAVGFLFLLGVLTLGRVSTFGPVVFAGALSALVWNYLFIPPRFTFAIREASDAIMCLTYFVVALITGTMTNRIKQQEKLVREKEERTKVLYEVLRDISSSREKTQFLEKVLRRIGGVLRADCGVLLKNRDGRIIQTDKSYALPVSEKEMAVAQWCFDHGKPAGWSTDTLSQSKALYIPLEGEREKVGVFVFMPEGERKLSLDQEDLLYSVCKQLGLSLERHFIENRIRENQRLQESEKLHQTLLNSISHEMRTPLTAIMGAASALTGAAEESKRRALVDELTQAGQRLNRVIENLLDMSRLESGALALKCEWHDLQDLIGVVLNRLSPNLSRHELKVELPEALPLVFIDFRLLEHALTNILYNAVVYTPGGTEIKVRAEVVGVSVRLIMEDNGPGIPPDSLDRLFEKFYRVAGSPTGGTGLGLSIAKSIVELHRGRIWAENVPTGGARFVISLPLLDAPTVPAEESV